MYRFYLLLSDMRKHKNKFITAAVAAVFVVLIIIFFVQINKLNNEIQTYESEIMFLSEKHSEYVSAISRHDKLLTEIAQLKNKSKELEDLCNSIKEENNELAAEKDELERQNGDLLKKFDGLSKPN